KGILSNGAFAWAGDNICRVDLNRSRLTISEPNDAPFNWTEGGCVNGDTQYVASGTIWTRATVPAEGNYLTASSFDPATGILRTQRWLPDADVMDKARALLKDGPIKGCSSDPEILGRSQHCSRACPRCCPPNPTSGWSIIAKRAG